MPEALIVVEAFESSDEVERKLKMMVSVAMKEAIDIPISRIRFMRLEIMFVSGKIM